MKNNSKSGSTPVGVIGIIAVIGLFFVIGGLKTVDANESGVEMHFGRVSDNAVQSGLHWINPIGGKIVRYNIRTQLMRGTTQSFTKDMQQAEVAYGVNYNIDRLRVKELHVNYGRDFSAVIIDPVVVSTMKNVIGQWEAERLINHRDEASYVIYSNLVEIIKEKNYPVDITQFSLYDIGYSDKFEKAIEEKVVAQQEALRAKNKTIQIEEEARQTEVKARGEAEAVKLRAEAEAESMKIRANALKENQDLVVLEFVNKWDGKLPTFLGASDMTQALMKNFVKQ